MLLFRLGISKTSQKLEEAEGKFDSIKDAETKLEKDKKDADSKVCELSLIHI